MSIIFILLLLHIISNLMFKPKHNTLNCGILAWAGKDPKKFNKYKFDILGIFNDSRGGDSCGVSTDGEIYYGVAVGQKHYKDFLIKKNYLTPKKIPTVIGHTRKSSVGVINVENAHPFGFGVNETYDSYEFIGCHNGTLHNHEELAKEFGINMNEYDSKNAWKRRKIDSEVLLECIYKSKNFKVLSDYNGGAAIVFYNTQEPNILYAFHGASPDCVNGKVEEERPLFYYIESKNSLYISSIEDSLLAIGGTSETVFPFDHNVVYKITDGDIKSAELFPVSRANCTQRKSHYGRSNTNISKFYGYGGDWEDYGDGDYTQSNSKKEKEVLRSQEKTNHVKKDISNIYEDVINKVLPSPIVFNKLRYIRNGHLVTGIYIFIPNYGLHLLCSESHKIIQETCNIMGMVFDTKSGQWIDARNFDETDKNLIIPYPISKGSQPQPLFIYEGVMVDTLEDFNLCINMKKDDVEFLSHCSKHPIIDLKYNYRTNSNQNIIKGDGMNVGKFTGRISPLGSGKIYTIEDGNLMSLIFINKVLEENQDKDNKVIQLNLPLPFIKQQDDEDFLKSLEALDVEQKNDFDLTNVKKIVDFINESEEDLEQENEDMEIATSIDSGITNILTEIQEVNSQLIDHQDNQLVKDFLSLNNDVIKTYDEFLQKNVNALIMNN